MSESAKVMLRLTDIHGTKVTINPENISILSNTEKGLAAYDMGGKTWIKYTKADGSISTCCAIESMETIKKLAKWNNIPKRIKINLYN